jgi:predicted MFS family arabinose efflux permease
MNKVVAAPAALSRARNVTLARLLETRGIHYGWVMVGLTFAFAVCAAGAMSIPGVLLTPISRDLGWSLGELSGPLGLRMALFGLVAPFAGGLISLYGPRKVLIGSGLLLMAGLLGTATTTAKWQLWLSLGVVLGVAPGITALVMTTTIATRWFTARRGLVLGFLSAGTATGQLVLLMPATWIAQTYGWRMALLPPAIIVALLMVLILVFAIDWPAEVALAPYGESAIAPPQVHPNQNMIALSIGALRSASGSPVFAVLTFSFFVCGISSFGLTPHFVPFCGDNGIGAMTSTALLTAIGVFDLFGTVGSGWLSDRFNNRLLLTFYYGFRGLSLLWLPYSGFSIAGLSLFAVFYGLDFIATVPPSVRLTAQTFGREQAPLVFGWIYAAHQLGAGLMAFAAGLARDSMSTYVPVFLTAGALCGLSAMLLPWQRTKARRNEGCS